MSHMVQNQKQSAVLSSEEGATHRRTPNPEAILRPARRRFTAKFKLELLEEIGRCVSAEERGAILRREGLYSSQICEWRKARGAGALSALSRKRGRRPTQSPQGKQVEQLEAENKRLKARLTEAETIIDIQKKVSEILGNKIHRTDQDEERS